MTPEVLAGTILLAAIGFVVIRSALAWVARRVIAIVFGWAFRGY